MSKPVKYALAVVVQNAAGEFLLVKRPDDDPDFGGQWGLPATTLRPGELPEQAAQRVCSEKLNCRANPTCFLSIMFQKRNAYDIFLMDVEMQLAGDKQPEVLGAKTEHTAYVDQKWSSDPTELIASAKLGACCSSIFLTDRGLLDRDAWIASLEGSDTAPGKWPTARHRPPLFLSYEGGCR